MSEEKGKGRASDLQDVSPKDDRTSQEAAAQKSMFSRITSSAAGLAGSALSAPNSNEINGGGSALLGDSKSSRTGTTETSSWAESSRATGQTRSPNESRPARFVNGHEEQHVQQMEAEFSSFLDGIEPFRSAPDAALQLDGGDAPNEAFNSLTLTQNALHDSPTNLERANLTSFSDLTVQEQEAQDGGDVVGILTSPSAVDESVESDVHGDELDLQLTPEQIQNIRSITNRFFPPAKPHMAPPTDHPLNFHPELEMFSDFGQNNENLEARTALVNEWNDVLTSYTDEVWGGLLPLVKEARQEVETIKDHDDSSTTPKALRRLAQIVYHLQK